MVYRCFNLELILVLDCSNAEHRSFKITEAVLCFFSKPVFLNSNIFSFKIDCVARGTLLTDYFMLRNERRNDCSLAAICFYDFF